MNWKIKYSLLGLAFWLLIFLGWEWWSSYPRIRFTPISNPDSREAQIDSLLIQSLSNYLIPGLAVGIIENQKVTYLKAFGFENLDTKDSLTLESAIPVASVSKIFTALSLASFALEKGISIDTAFNSILPKHKKLPAEFDSITLRDLLDHTSGLTDKGRIQNILVGPEKRKLKNLPKNLNSPDLANKDYNYADINFDLIGYVLESCAKTPFENLIETTLSSGGMEQSYFLLEEPTGSSPIAGYKQTFLWKRIQRAKLKIGRSPSPSSGLVATPLDLSKALLHLCRGDMGNFAEELEWLRSNSNAPAGFQNITLNQTEFLGHFGGFGGFSSLVIYSSSHETGLLLLSNASDKTDFRQQITAEILHLISRQ